MFKRLDTENIKIRFQRVPAAKVANPANQEGEESEISKISEISTGIPQMLHFSEDEHFPPYPNENGQVKCDYCANLTGATCSQGHQPDGTTLLRMCQDFNFNLDAYQEFYDNQS